MNSYLPTQAGFSRLVADIAAQLGVEWTVTKAEIEHTTPRATLTHATDGQLGISSEYGDEGKLSISGNFLPWGQGITRAPDGTEIVLSHTIRVSPDRGAAVIAREIARRLLPNYFAALAQFRAALKARDAYTVRVVENTDRIAALCHGRISGEVSNGELSVNAAGLPRLRVSGSSVTFEAPFAPSLNVAERLVRVLVAAEDAKRVGRALDGPSVTPDAAATLRAIRALFVDDTGHWRADVNGGDVVQAISELLDQAGMGGVDA